MNNTYGAYSLLLAMLVFSSGCTLFTGGAYTVHGNIQKGPYITGTAITLQELNKDYEPTGVSYQVETTDDFGSFTITGVKTDKIEIIAAGYYFNEVEGTLSSSTLRLTAIVDLTTNETANVNILTTVAKERIKHLATRGGLSFEKAKIQAEKEVLGIFSIREETTAFDDMDISQPGAGNAILLAVSAVIQGRSSVAEVSELISKISSDIKNDGTLEDQAHIAQIRDNGMNLILDKVRSNIEDRYSALGLDVQIPGFEGYVDSDGDRVLNKADGRYWSRATAHAGFSPRYDHTVVVFNNKMWVIGGDAGSVDKYQNDVWSSTDGVHWILETDEAAFPPRGGHTAVVFDGKIWIIGGRSLDDYYDGSTGFTWGGWWFLGDVWQSIDGVNWTQVEQLSPFTPRMNHASVVFHDKMWIIGGLTVLPSPGFLDEVYSSEDGATWTKEASLDHGTFSHSSIVFDDKIWVIGGSPFYGPSSRIVYSEDGVIWYSVNSNNLFSARAGHRCIVYDGKIWAIGGAGDTYPSTMNKEVWQSADGIDWKLFSAKGEFSSSVDHECVVFADKLWLIGGAVKEGGMANDVWYTGPQF